MSLHSSHEILAAAESLPMGSALIISEVTWNDYESIVESLAEHPHLRVSYDCGRLEILSPSQRHDQYIRFIDDLVRAFAHARKIPLEKFGSATWKRSALAKGIEADACYYVNNASQVIGKKEFDLEMDPPPDIALEIDVTKDSTKKLSIYAAFRVPEVWRYDGEEFLMYELSAHGYTEINCSHFLPGLSGAIFTEFIELSQEAGQTGAFEQFLARISQF